MKNLSKKFLMVLATGLVLASCGEPKKEESKSDIIDSVESVLNSDNSSPTQQESQNPGETTESLPASSSSAPVSRPDFTAGWTALPALAEEISNYCGGNQIPFIDLQGEYHAVKVPKSATLAAHLMIYTSGSFDRTLVYNTKVTYELAGWFVSFDVNTLELYAEDPETGIEINFYGKPNTREGGYTPYLDIYFIEKFKTPESGAWSSATNAVLAAAGIAKPHALPYCYLGTVVETATQTSKANVVEIKGGDWQAYESQILGAVQNSLSGGRNWVYAKGTSISGYGKYPSNVYTFKKSFSDDYTLSCKLYGATDDYYYTSSSAIAEVWARLEVTVSK